MCYCSEKKKEQESPPAWTQEAYHPSRSKCSLCWGVGGTLSQVRGGYPSQIWGEGDTPSQVWGGTLSQTWDGVPPPTRPGMGYPPRTWDGGGTPAPASVERHTDSCQNINFPRTMYAGGNKNNVATLFPLLTRFKITPFTNLHHKTARLFSI